MSEARPHNSANPRPPGRLRQLADGVLPEVHGLVFVAIIFSGFVATYLVADFTWQRQQRAAVSANNTQLARGIASAIGRVATRDPEQAEQILAAVGSSGSVQRIAWSLAGGQLRFEWPRTLHAQATPIPAPAGASGRALTTSVPIPGPNGVALGTLHVTRAMATSGQYRSALLWGCGLSACLTLLVFLLTYRWLRRHLRPVAAIERNLRSLCDQDEQELLTMRLSEALGPDARAWNRLLDRLADLQRRAARAGQGQATGEVLARFENAVFRRVVDGLPFGVLRIDRESQIAYANGAAGALLGKSADQLVKTGLAQHIDDDAVLQAVSAVQRRAAGAPVVDHSTGEGDAEMILRFRVMPVHTDSGTGDDVLVTIEDISQLREGQRARDNFLYHVTHELRTPLTNIHAYAETLTKPGFDDEQTRRECYNVLISETERLSRLVEDILSVSQMEVGTARLNIADVDLVRLLRQMVQDNLGAADDKNINLTLNLPPKVPKVSGDKQRLAVLLNNLIGNAIKYTLDGGKVNVKLDVQDEHLHIAFEDSGIGIKPEDQTHIFDKFYRAADDTVQMIPGTGLGLALAREVARLHGGDIYLASTPGHGSTFTVDLPLTSAAPVEVATR